MAEKSLPDIEAELTSTAFNSDPHRVHELLRQTAPVYWSESALGWLTTSYALVEEVLGEPSRFSSHGAETEFINQLGGHTGERTENLRAHFEAAQLNTTDPPDHTRIRRVFGRSFLPRNVASYEGDIAKAATEILAEASPRHESLDVVADFAEPLPVRVISDVIGVPESHRTRIPAVTMDQRRFFGSASPNLVQGEAFDSTLEEWNALLGEWMAERQLSPAGDVITVAAEHVAEGRLTREEATATLLHLIIAGNSTTTGLIGNAVYALLTHPEQLDAVQRDRSLMANCIEEALRWEAPLPRDRRIATESTSLGGVTIPKGDRVYAVLAAANRDPAEYDRPGEFDITRKFSLANHTSFGRGIHLCLGAPLARLEARVALEVLLDHIPRPQLAAGFTPVWHDIATHRGLIELPIQASP